MTIQESSIGGYLVAGIFFLMALWLVPASLGQIIRGSVSEGWTPIEAKITKSASTHSKHSKLIINYVYEVDETEYTGDVVYFGAAIFYFAWENVSAVSKKYPEDETVTAYYNPAEPEESCLEPGINTMAVVEFLMSAVYLAVCAFYIRKFMAGLD